MIRRRSLLAGAGIALLSPLSGCAGGLGFGSSGPHPIEQFVPSATALGPYGSTLRENDYAVWGVDVSDIRARLDGMSEDARKTFDTNIPVRDGVAHEDVGIPYDDVDRVALAGTPRVNSLPRGVDHLGMLVASVTTGDFDHETVVDALDGDLLREDYGGVARFLDDGLSYAVDDGWLVTGFDRAVRAAVDSRRGDVDRYVDADPAIDRIVTDLTGTTFFSAMRHDRHETTDVENGTLRGQIAEGFGYSFTDETPTLDAVLVFDDAESIDEGAVTDWARGKLANVPEPNVSVADDAVTVTGETDRDALRFTTFAFVPFVFAEGSAP